MNVATPVSGRKAGTLQGVILLLPVTMAVMGLIVLVPVLPQMMRQFHAVPGAEYLVPLVLTLPALCIAVLAPIAGAIVDAIGRRRTLIGALVMYSVAGVMPIFLNSLTAIIASRIVVGAMESAVVTASTTLIGDYFHGQSRERWLANQTAVASISSIFLALLGGALGNLGWRAPFAAYAVGLLFAAGLILWTWEPRRVEQPSTELAGPAARFPWRAMAPVALLAVFGGVMFFMMQIQVSNLLNDYYGISSPAMLGLFTSTAGLSVAAGTIAYRRMARYGIATQLLLAFGLLGVSYVMMDHAPSALSLTGWLVANQLGCGILLPSLVVLVMGRLPFEVRGRGTGVFMTAWWLGQPLSTQLAAWVRQLVGGSLPAALQIFGILCLLAAAAALASRLATRHSTAVV